ncbi:MAG: phage portal protein [Ruminiclostridium sp.]|nr:phage portal protein [Ruminiclostridium sp.]
MNLLNFFNKKTIEQVTGIDVGISAEMFDAIKTCNAIMTHNAAWNGKAESCGIPDQIAGMLAETVMQEIGVEARNEAISPAMEHLNANVTKLVQYISLVGGCVIRPLFVNEKLQYEALPLGNYLPMKYDFDGTLLSALVIKNIAEKGRKFVLIERHEYDNGNHAVESTLYRNDGGVLSKTALTACSQTADITPSYVWQNVAHPMIVEFRSHIINKIDGSDVPVSLIWSVKDLIKDADMQYHRMVNEQELGEKVVFADSDLFVRRQTRDGNIVNTTLAPKLKNLVVEVDGNIGKDGDKICEYSPALRTEQQAQFLQQVFRRIEMTMNIGKGAISDLGDVPQTATQYTGGRKSFYSIVDTIEDEIEQKYHACAEVFAHMAAAYGLGSNDSSITVTWNDALRKDPTSEKQIAMQEVSNGVMSKVEYRMKFYGEDEATAVRAVEAMKSEAQQGAFVL